MWTESSEGQQKLKATATVAANDLTANDNIDYLNFELGVDKFGITDDPEVMLERENCAIKFYQATATNPFFSIRFNNFNAAPPGCFSPRSQCFTVDGLTFRYLASMG